MNLHPLGYADTILTNVRGLGVSLAGPLERLRHRSRGKRSGSSQPGDNSSPREHAADF